MANTNKLCKDCVYYRFVPEQIDRHCCVYIQPEISLITGEQLQDFTPAVTVRYDETKCGEDGKWFARIDNNSW